MWVLFLIMPKEVIYMSLNKEIERKWLIDKSKIPFDLSAAEPLRMK